MSDDDRQSRTEEPTENKIREATEKGNLPVSREAAGFAALLGMLAVATLLLPRAAASATTLLSGLIDHAWGIPLANGADASALFVQIGLGAGLIVLPLVAVLGGCGLLASAVQTPFRLIPSRLQPDFSRISPRQGLRRLIGIRGAAEFLKSVVKTIGIGAIVACVLKADSRRLFDAMFEDPASLPAEAIVVVVHLLSASALAVGLLAGLDVIWTRRKWRQDLRMTHHEIKEEHRQSEGDPLVKARLRSVALDRARRRMMSNVPRATLIVTNPTHFAVALRYVRAEGGAPIVVAKGQDLLALRIRETAAEHAIPIIENKPLARALYAQVEVDHMIPAEFYRAVAEILNMLDRGKRGVQGVAAS